MTQGSAPTPEEQLEAIASLGAALDTAGTWRADYDAIGTALRAAGWRHTPVADEVVGTRYQLGTAQVELTFLVTDDAGRVVVPLPGAPIVVSAAPLGSAIRQLHGVTARTFPLALLRSGKETEREGPVEGAKDRADRESLARVVE